MASQAGVDLENEDLRQADLRGLDLTGANLRGADLRGARTGMGRGWFVTVLVFALLLSVAVGIASGIFGARLERLIVSTDPLRRFVGVFIAAELCVLLVASVLRGVRAASAWLLPPLAALVVAGTVVGLSTGGTGAGGVALILLSMLFVVLLFLGALARVTAGAARSSLLFMVVAVSGALAGRALGGGLAAAALAISAMIVGRRALREPNFSPLLSRLSTAIACRGGTSLRNADLRGAHLEAAELRCTDLRGARLDASALEQARVHLCALDQVGRVT